MQNSLNNANATPGFNVDAPAFSYDLVFPALSTPTPGPQPKKAWGATATPRIGSSIITQHFVISREERKFDNSDKFGEKDNPCSQIMQATNTTIEIFAGKDQNLAFLVCGKPNDVHEARKRIIASFQTPHQTTIDIPCEYHGVILGKKGKNLQKLEGKTGCKIKMPDKDSNSNTIVISGPRSGVEKASYEIKVAYDEASRQAYERLQVPKIYHPFICGGHNDNITSLQEQNDVRITVPPVTVQRDEIIIAGSKEGVAIAKEAICAIYREMEKKCKQVCVEVPRSQHKHIMGPKGLNLSEILKQTGVAVEIPLDETTDTITLRGPQDSLGRALTMVCEKASSIKTVTIDAPAWLHKRLRGKRGANIQRISHNDPRIHFEFKEDSDSVKIEGPSLEVTRVQEEMEKETAEYLKTLVHEEFTIDGKYAKHIIGKGGVKLNRHKEETGVEINIVEDNNVTTIQMEGTPEGVAKVKAEMQDMISKMENEKDVSLNVDLKLIRATGRVKELRDAFPDVSISLPPPGKKGEVRLRGPIGEVDQCAAQMRTLARELAETNHSVQIPVNKQFHRVIIGKGGNNIKKIRDDTGCIIDLPNVDDESDVITIIGPESEVNIAKERIQKIQLEMATSATQEIPTTTKFYNVAMRSRPRFTQNIADNNGVQIKFVDTSNPNIRLIVRGAKDDVERAVKQLETEMKNVEAASYTARIKIDPKYHKLIVGRRGTTVSKIQDSTNTIILLPNEGDDDKETVEILGKKEEVERAQKELEQKIDSIENTIEIEMYVDPKHQRVFTTNRRQLINEIQDEFGGVNISFPRFKDEKVKIRGSRNFVELAQQRIEEIDGSIVTLNVDIPNVYHRTLKRNPEIQNIERDEGVIINFPKTANRSNENADTDSMNGSNDEPSDVVTLTGLPDHCERAKETLMSLLPIHVQEPVPSEMRPAIIGRKGDGIKAMQTQCPNVKFVMSPSEDPNGYVELIGAAADVEEARKIVRNRIDELEKEKEDRALRSFSLTMEVNSEYYKDIVGPRGKVLNQIRSECNVVVNLPKRDGNEQEIITIIGLEENAYAARDKILSIVNGVKPDARVEVEIDSRLHSRLIGTKRRTITRLESMYGVQVRFPRRDGPNSDVVIIEGTDEDTVNDAKEKLLEMAEEISTSMEDWLATPAPIASSNGPEEAAGGGRGEVGREGFVVTGAPWQQTPNTDSIKDFPSFGLPDQGGANAPSVATWGPRR